MIHQSAVVSPEAEIGENVAIGPFCVVEAGVRIGGGCVLGPHVTVLGGTTLGAECRVHAGAVLGDLPQDLAFAPCASSVRIGDRCVLREGVTIHRGTKEGSCTELGSDCYLMAFSHCAHNVRLGDRVIIANGAVLGGYAQVGDRAFISGNCMVHQFVRVGQVAMLGGGSGASKDVPPFCTIRPITANRVAGLNVVGMRRAGLSADERADVKRAFTLLYRSGLSMREALARIEQDCSSEAAGAMVAFARESTRGLCGLDAGADEA